MRLRLQKIRTLNAEFMSLSPGLDDASVTRRLFYSIKDISIGGQCVCSGHASKCTQNGKFGVSRANMHNTSDSNMLMPLLALACLYFQTKYMLVS